MMRLVLCVGDQPETGGYIEPMTVGVPSSIRGHAVSFIGALRFAMRAAVSASSPKPVARVEENTLVLRSHSRVTFCFASVPRHRAWWPPCKTHRDTMTWPSPWAR
jgi:hypothetical protein